MVTTDWQPVPLDFDAEVPHQYLDGLTDVVEASGPTARWRISTDVAVHQIRLWTSRSPRSWRTRVWTHRSSDFSSRVIDPSPTS